MSKKPEQNRNIERIFSLIKSINTQIDCYSGENKKSINVSDIFYIEDINKKTVVYCENEKYETDTDFLKLYEKLSGSGFVKINNLCILNINKLEKISLLKNSKIEAFLINGKSLFITSKHLDQIKRFLLET